VDVRLCRTAARVLVCCAARARAADRRGGGLAPTRWAGSRIAGHTGLSRATVSRILRRLKLNRIRHLEPVPVYPRYEHEAPGDMLHLDIKKLAPFTSGTFRTTGCERDRVRGGGFEYVHVAIDDHSRIAAATVPSNEQAGSAVALQATLAW
jgi:hypothetical protein